MIIALIFLTSCATTTRGLREVSLGMSKDDVATVLGEPVAARGAIRNKYDQVIEVWEYRLAVPDDGAEIARKSTITLITLGFGAPVFLQHEKREYWLYFHDAVLVQWGEAGDWPAEADRIYEIRFDPPSALAR
jgi:hypothetical protein